jgi:hypothetical protein
MALIFNIETARNILIDILKHLTLPENSKRLQEAKGLLIAFLKVE